MCYRTGKYTVCRRVRASFSPEGLQAGAVNGLMSGVVESYITGDKTFVAIKMILAAAPAVDSSLRCFVREGE